MINKIFQEHAHSTANSNFVVNRLKITTVLYLTLRRGPLGWAISISIVIHVQYCIGSHACARRADKMLLQIS
jgi:hypothetical protein